MHTSRQSKSYGVPPRFIRPNFGYANRMATISVERQTCCPHEINPLAVKVLNRIVEQQTALNRIVTGWFLTPAQLADIADDLSPHDPHPNVGGLGRLSSVPVFPIDDFGQLKDATQSDVCDGVRFTFVQMDIVN